MWEILCVSLLAKFLPLVSCLSWFFVFHKLWVLKRMICDCFSVFGVPNLWHLSSNPRYLTRTFRTFYLICPSVSLSAGLITSMTMHTRCWYCWRSSIFFLSSEFVFLTTIGEVSSNSTFCSSCLILVSSRDVLISLFDLVESFLFGVFDTDGVVLWLWFCLLL